MSRNNSLPLGCLIPILVFCGIGLYVSIRESPEDKKKRIAIHNAYAQKYDYSPDSIAKNLVFDYTNDKLPQLKGKCLVLYEYQNKITFNPQATVKLSESLNAYKISELKTVIIQSFSKEILNDFGKHGKTREKAQLMFIDFQTKKLVYTTTVLGTHYYESKGRKGSTSEYHLYEADVAAEVNRIINKSEF